MYLRRLLNITYKPLSARPITNINEKPVPSLASSSPPSTIQNLRDFRNHRQGKKTQTREDEQSEKPVGTSTLQVAMSIAMPSPRRHSEGGEDDHEEGLEYCIGLVDVPCQRLDDTLNI